MDPTVLELEARLDLQFPLVRAAPTASLIRAAEEWADAVWAVAARQGPLVPSQHDVARGIDLTRRAVFICGAHRSGTTLVHDLLDGHRALTVLPSEGMFVTSFEKKLNALPREDAVGFMGRQWLRRLANPMNQPPFWLLGRSHESGSPYVGFARALVGWWSAIEPRLGRSVASWPLVAISLAYAGGGRGVSVPDGIERWVEKTPTNESHLVRLWTEFPEAKVIHVVRDPASTFASRRTLESHPAQPFRHAHHIRREMALSYRVATERARSERGDRYLLLLYEDLVSSPHAEMDRVAAFLGIEALPTLRSPTVAGRAAATNSSYGVSGSPGQIVPAPDRAAGVLSAWDRQLLAATMGEAAALGYPLDPIGPWRRVLVRLASQVL